MITDNPAVKSILASGQARLGPLVQKVMSNDAVMDAVQSTVTYALHAKERLDKSVRGLAQAFHLPTIEEVEALQSKVAELEQNVRDLMESGRTGASEPAKPRRAKRS